jgi:ABC-type transport system substrate-binding protein
VEIRLREPSVILPTVLGAIGPFAAIYPKEVIDASGDGPLKEFVGTGPFQPRDGDASPRAAATSTGDGVPRTGAVRALRAAI